MKVGIETRTGYKAWHKFYYVNYVEFLLALCSQFSSIYLRVETAQAVCSQRSEAEECHTLLQTSMPKHTHTSYEKTYIHRCVSVQNHLNQNQYSRPHAIFKAICGFTLVTIHCGTCAGTSYRCRLTGFEARKHCGGVVIQCNLQRMSAQSLWQLQEKWYTVIVLWQLMTAARM